MFYALDNNLEVLDLEPVFSYLRKREGASSEDWLIDCFTAHQHRKAISAKKRC